MSPSGLRLSAAAFVVVSLLFARPPRARAAGPEEPARTASESDAAPSSGDGLVPVVFEPREPHMVLERRDRTRTGVDSEGTTALCVAGCRTRLDPHATYQIGGTWVTPAAFRLPEGARGPLRITATAGSSRTDQLGTGLALGGGMMMALGGVATGALLGLGATKNEDAGSPASVALVSSITVAAAGVVMLLVSLPFRGDVTRVDVRAVP